MALFHQTLEAPGTQMKTDESINLFSVLFGSADYNAHLFDKLQLYFEYFSRFPQSQNLILNAFAALALTHFDDALSLESLVFLMKLWVAIFKTVGEKIVYLILFNIKMISI